MELKTKVILKLSVFAVLNLAVTTCYPQQQQPLKQDQQPAAKFQNANIAFGTNQIDRQQNQLPQQNQGQGQQPQQNFQTNKEYELLPPVFIPPSSPQGPPPALQSPIRNLFKRPQQENNRGGFFSNIINRIVGLFTG